MFSDVTGIGGIPGSDMPKVMAAFDALRSKYTTEMELTAYLKPYFENWITRKTKDGRRYSKSNCAWLYDLALVGDVIPGNEKKVIRKPDPDCPKCGGLGFVSYNVKVGHENFGKFKTCDCVKEVVNAGVN